MLCAENDDSVTLVFAVMIKYVTPVFILLLDVAGIITNVSKNSKYWYIVGFAGLLVIASIIVYYLFLKNTNTGTNADEIEKQ